MGAGGPELTGAVAQGDVRRREPESQSGPEPSDRVRDRQEESKSKKSEKNQAAATRRAQGSEENRTRRRHRQGRRRESPRRRRRVRPLRMNTRARKAVNECGAV